MSDLPALDAGNVQWNGDFGMVQFNDRRNAEFFVGTKLHGLRTEAEGRPVHVPVVLLKVFHPGERYPLIVEKQPHHEFEFARQWAAFQAGEQADAEGTPISVLFPTNEALVRTLRGRHIFTVEQLADLSEPGIQGLGMGARRHVERAKQYLDAARGGAANHKLQAQLEREAEKRTALEAEMEQMRRQLAVLAAAAEAADVARPRGRPRKAEQTEGEPE